jgi:hypothetical protein
MGELQRHGKYSVQRQHHTGHSSDYPAMARQGKEKLIISCESFVSGFPYT